MTHEHGSGPPVHVVITLDFPTPFLERMAALDPRLVIDHHPVGEGDDPAAAVPPEVLRRAEVMYSSMLLPGPDAAPHLRWVQLDTSGIDHVRGSALWERDVTLTTLGGISPAPLAEWVIMMILADAHHLPHLLELQRAGTWPTRDYRWQRLMPRNLRESTLVIVGLGRIGQELARMATTLGMTVVGVRRGDARPDGLFGGRADPDGVETVTVDRLDDVLPLADYLALTVPLTRETVGLIGDAQLSRCRPGTVLVNGARGGVVDEDAMVRALDDGRLRLVASDVFAEEPLPAGHPFWRDPRIIVSPHVAGFAPDYEASVEALFGANLRRYLDGEPLLNVADRERGY